jgi:hypothetical protein
MTRFLIEVPHEANKQSCERAVQTFLDTGSHFMTHADWGCHDDEHKAWFTVEMDSKDEAISILPPALRRDAKVITLQRFTVDDIDETLKQHER